MAGENSKAIGVWRLLRIEAVSDDGRSVSPGYGNAPAGLLSIQQNGRMMAMVTDGRPADETSGEREHNSYCGTYTIEKDSFTTRVDGGNRAAWIGGAQVRGIEWDGEALVLVPPPDMLDGKRRHRRFVWQRLE